MRSSTDAAIRALTVVDDYSRESLAIEVGQSIIGEPTKQGECSMVKLIICVKRKTGMSRKEFDAYWQNQHGPLVKSVPIRIRLLKDLPFDSSI